MLAIVVPPLASISRVRATLSKLYMWMADRIASNPGGTPRRMFCYCVYRGSIVITKRKFIGDLVSHLGPDICFSLEEDTDRPDAPFAVLLLLLVIYDNQISGSVRSHGSPRDSDENHEDLSLTPNNFSP